MAETRYLIYCVKCGFLILPPLDHWPENGAPPQECAKCQPVAEVKPAARAIAVKRPVRSISEPITSSTQSNQVKIIAVLVCVAVVLGLSLFLVPQKSGTRKVEATAPPATKVVEVSRTPTPPIVESKPILTQPAPIVPVAVPVKSAWDALQADLRGLEENDLDGRIRRLEAFLILNLESTLGDQARAQIDQLKAQQLSKLTTVEATPPETLVAKNPPPPEVPAAVKPPEEPAKPAVVARDDSVKTFMSALRKGHLDGAIKTAELTEPALGLALKEVVDSVKAREIALQTALKNMLGKQVTLESTSAAPANGKLTSFENGKLMVEKQFIINGEVKGSTSVSVEVSDLTPACREHIAPTPAPTNPAAWAGKALIAASQNDFKTAQLALQKAESHVLVAPLTAIINEEAKAALETEARVKWAMIETKSKQASSQSSAKSLLQEIATFEKNYSLSKIAQDTAQPRTVMREELERVATGLDPRLSKLIKGKIVEYDARNQRIVIDYDFQSDTQLEDWNVKSGPGEARQGGIGKHKDGIQLFCGGSSNMWLQSSLVESGDFSVSLTYKFEIPSNYAAQARVIVFLYRTESEGKMPDYAVALNPTDVVLETAQGLAGREKFRSSGKTYPLEGKLEVACLGNAVNVKCDGKVVLEQTLPQVNDRKGIMLGGGWGTSYLIKNMRLSGKLNLKEVARVLETFKK